MLVRFFFLFQPSVMLGGYSYINIICKMNIKKYMETFKHNQHLAPAHSS